MIKHLHKIFSMEYFCWDTDSKRNYGLSTQPTCHCMQQRFTEQEMQQRGIQSARSVSANSLLNSQWIISATSNVSSSKRPGGAEDAVGD